MARRTVWIVVTGLGLIGVALAVRSRLNAAASDGPRTIPRGSSVRSGVRFGDPTPYLARMRLAAARHPELNGLFAVYVGLINHESAGFQADAVSSTGAGGLGQFTSIGRREVERILKMAAYRGRFSGEPRIAERLKEFLRAEQFEPDLALEAAALYLASLIATYNFNVEAALTAYNAGGKAARIVQQSGTHAAALTTLLLLPSNQRSQSPTYAPRVLEDAAHFRSQGIA